MASEIPIVDPYEIEFDQDTDITYKDPVTGKRIAVRPPKPKAPDVYKKIGTELIEDIKKGIEVERPIKRALTRPQRKDIKIEPQFDTVVAPPYIDSSGKWAPSFESAYPGLTRGQSVMADALARPDEENEFQRKVTLAEFDREMQKKNAPGYVEQLGNRFARGYMSSGESMLKGVSLLNKESATDPTTQFLYETPQEKRATYQRLMPIDEYDNSLPMLAAQGLGSSVPFMMGGIAAGPLSTYSTALLGAASNAGSTYDDAIARGADDSSARYAAVVGAVIGLGEAAGIGRIKGSSKLPFQMNPLARVGQYALQTGQEGAEEWIQETASQILNNVNAKVISGYDPNRAIQEEVWENGLSGFLTGVLAGGASSGASRLALQADPQYQKLKAFDQEFKLYLNSPVDERIADLKTFTPSEVGDLPAAKPLDSASKRISFLNERIEYLKQKSGAAQASGDSQLAESINQRMVEMESEMSALQENRDLDMTFDLLPSLKSGQSPAMVVPNWVIAAAENRDYSPTLGVTVPTKLFGRTLGRVMQRSPSREHMEAVVDALWEIKNAASDEGLSSIALVSRDALTQGYSQVPSHESLHVGQIAAAEKAGIGESLWELHDKEWAKTNPFIQKVIASGKGSEVLTPGRAPEDLLAVELPVYVMTNEATRFFDTDEEGDDFVMDYFTHILHNRGVEALNEIERAHRALPGREEIIPQVRSIYESHIRELIDAGTVPREAGDRFLESFIAGRTSEVPPGIGSPRSRGVGGYKTADEEAQIGSLPASEPPRGIAPDLRESNLNRFLEKSSVKVPLYHGTSSPSEIVGIDPSKFAPNALYGPGFYMTQSSEIAAGDEGYATTTVDRYQQPVKMEGPFGDEIEVLESIGKPRAYQLYTNIQKPLNVEQVSDVELGKKLDQLVGFDYPVLQDGVTPDADNQEIYQLLTRYFGTKEEVNDWLQAQGYDGITHIGGITNSPKWFQSEEEARIYADQTGGDLLGPENIPFQATGPMGEPWMVKGHRVWIAFPNAQVKSATGNIGAFDPSNEELSAAIPPPLKTVSDPNEREDNLLEFLRDSQTFYKSGDPIKLYIPSIARTAPNVLNINDYVKNKYAGLELYQSPEAAEQDLETNYKYGTPTDSELEADPDFEAIYNQQLPFVIGDWKRQQGLLPSRKFDDPIPDYVMPYLEERARIKAFEILKNRYPNVPPGDVLPTNRSRQLQSFYANITNPFDLEKGFTPEEIERIREGMIKELAERRDKKQLVSSQNYEDIRFNVEDSALRILEEEAENEIDRVQVTGQRIFEEMGKYLTNSRGGPMWTSINRALQLAGYDGYKYLYQEGYPKEFNSLKEARDYADKVGGILREEGGFIVGPDRWITYEVVDPTTGQKSINRRLDPHVSVGPTVYGSTVWGIWNRSQIKSATGNIGAYDPSNEELSASTLPPLKVGDKVKKKILSGVGKEVGEITSLGQDEDGEFAVVTFPSGSEEIYLDRLVKDVPKTPSPSTPPSKTPPAPPTKVALVGDKVKLKDVPDPVEVKYRAIDGIVVVMPDGTVKPFDFKDIEFVAEHGATKPRSAAPRYTIRQKAILDSPIIEEVNPSQQSLPGIEAPKRVQAVPELEKPAQPRLPGVEESPILFQRHITPEVVRAVTEGFKALLDAGAIKRDPTQRVFLQVYDAVMTGKINPRKFSDLLDENNLSIEDFASELEETASEAGRILGEFSRLSRYTVKFMRENPDLAKKVIPNKVMMDAILREIETDVLGRNFLDRASGLGVGLILSDQFIAIRNIVTTLKRIPILGGTHAIAAWVKYVNEGSPKGMNYPDTIAEANHQALMAFEPMAEVLAHMTPPQLRRFLNFKGMGESEKYTEAIIQLSKHFPHLEKELAVPGFGPDKKSDDAMVEMEGNVETARQILNDMRIDIKDRDRLERRFKIAERRLESNTKGIGRVLRGIEWPIQQMMRPANFAEKFFRHPVFYGHLAMTMKEKGWDLADAIRFEKGQEKDLTTEQRALRFRNIPEEDLKSAIDEALYFTHAYMPRAENGPLEAAGRMMIQALNVTRPVTGPALNLWFAKAMFNSMKFTWEYVPLIPLLGGGVPSLLALPLGMIGPASRIMFPRIFTPVKGDPIPINPIRPNDYKRFAAGIVGTIMYTMANALLDAGGGGDEWWQIDTGRKGKKGQPLYVDIRSDMPLANWFRVADLNRRVKDGRLNDLKFSQEMLELYTGMQRGAPDMAEALDGLMEMWADGDEPRESAYTNVGRRFSFVTKPFANIRNLWAIFSEEENKRKDLKGTRFLGPLIDNLPYFRRSLPDVNPPTQEPPVLASEYPATQWVPGIKLVEGESFAGREWKRMGFYNRRFLQPDPNPLINRAQNDYFRKQITGLGDTLEKSEYYKSLDDSGKAALWEYYISGDGGIASEAREAGAQADYLEQYKRQLREEAGGELQRKASGMEERIRNIKAPSPATK
jgi:hypothetical protein